MAIKIEQPTVIQAAGNKPKVIEEYIGQVNSQTSGVSIARMTSPGRMGGAGTKTRIRRIQRRSARSIAGQDGG